MRVLTSALSSVLFTLMLVGPLTGSAQAQTLSGRRAPSFSLPDSAFKRYDLLDYRGKWLLINFVATQASQCTACPTVSSRLDTLRKAHQGQVEVLTVVVAPPETLATVSAYVKASQITNPVVFDQGQMTASYFNATPQSSQYDTPHVFAINPDGRIVQDWGQVGAASPNMITRLEELIGAK